MRRWVGHFGEQYAAELRRRERRPGQTWHLDEVFVRIITDRLASYGAALQRLPELALSVDGARHELRPLIREVEWLRRASLPNAEDRD